MGFMNDYRTWFKSMTGRKITVEDIADIIGISRATATRRLQDGLAPDDIIKLCRKLNVNPVLALVDFDHLTFKEVFDALDGDGQLLATASTDQLIYRLAEDGLSPGQKMELSSHIRRSHIKAVSDAPDINDGTVREFDYAPEEYAADSSIDETEARLERGEDIID